MSADNYIAVRQQDNRYYVTMEFESANDLSPITDKDATFANYQDAVDYAFGWEVTAPCPIEYGVRILCDKPEQPLFHTERDVEFEVMLDEKVDELDSEIRRHHKDFESISALCTLWRNGRMTAEDVVYNIQNIVG